MNKQIVVDTCGAALSHDVSHMQRVSTNYDLSWHVLSGSGGQMDSTSYVQRSTAGQVIRVF